MLEEKRFAVLIDADNISAKYIKYIIDEVSSYGVVTYKRIYADWTTSNNNHWKDVLLEYSINPIQQYRYTTGKNSSDSALIIDAMDILYSENIEGFCLVSSDSDFTKLATRLRESGMQVVGMGEQKTPKPFVSACNIFKYLDVLAKPKDPEDNKIIKSKVAEQADNKAKAEKAMTSIETITNHIVKIITDSGDEDFGMNIGNLGHQITKTYPDFDTRNFGHSKFSKFLEEIGLRVEINQNKQLVYLDEDLIPKNDKKSVPNQAQNSKPQQEKTATPKVETEKFVAPKVETPKNISPKVEIEETILKVDDSFFTKHPAPSEKKEVVAKPNKKPVDNNTKAIIMDLLRESTKHGIGLTTEYVHKLLCEKKPDFNVKHYGFDSLLDFFKNLDCLQVRQIRDGGDLLYLKYKFLNAPIKKAHVQKQNNKPTVENTVENKIEEKTENKVEDKVTEVAKTPEHEQKSSLFKITKLQDGIPSDKSAVMSSEQSNSRKVVAPQKIELNTPAPVVETPIVETPVTEIPVEVETKMEKIVNVTEPTKVTDVVAPVNTKANTQADIEEEIPEFSDEYKLKIKQEIYNMVKEAGETGIYIGTLGKIVTTDHPEFDIRGFGFMKLSSYLKSLSFIRLKSKNMSRRNIWAYFTGTD